ncbi:MAG: hypothetical protein K5986_11915 [Clostridium sp.]|nr:hypothetical protein [Clostridium sp.]
MGSTLTRIKNIMSCNVRKFLANNKKSEDEIRQYIRKFESEAGKLKAQYESILAEEKRRKRALNECEDSIAKMDRYIKKSLEGGNSSDVRLFEDKKSSYMDEKIKLEKAYETAKKAADKIKNAESKVFSDIEILKERLDNINEMNVKSEEDYKKSKINNTLKDLEREINRKSAEAEGMKEINEFLSESSSEDDDLDKLFEELENDNK